jgi:hypothetical protein
VTQFEVFLKRPVSIQAAFLWRSTLLADELVLIEARIEAQPCDCFKRCLTAASAHGKKGWA